LRCGSAHIRSYNGKLSQIRNATIGRVKVIRDRTRYIIALIIKESVSEIIEQKMVTETIAALLDVVIGFT